MLPHHVRTNKQPATEHARSQASRVSQVARGQPCATILESCNDELALSAYMRLPLALCALHCRQPRDRCCCHFPPSLFKQMPMLEPRGAAHAIILECSKRQSGWLHTHCTGGQRKQLQKRKEGERKWRQLRNTQRADTAA